jgi:hypothetical protein
MTDEPDNYFGYVPDSGDFAWMDAREGELASLRSEYHTASKHLSEYQKHTDRQLRGFYKGKNTIARMLSRRHHFDVSSDSFEVEIADDVYETIPWPYDDSTDEIPRDLTRKDKGREKTQLRRAVRRIKMFDGARGRNPAQLSVVRKAGALPPVVAT